MTPTEAATHLRALQSQIVGLPGAEAEALRLAAETLCTPPRGTYVSFDEICPREVPAVCTCGHAWRLGNDCPGCQR